MPQPSDTQSFSFADIAQASPPSQSFKFSDIAAPTQSFKFSDIAAHDSDARFTVHGTGEARAYEPSWWDRVKSAFTQGIPQYSTRTVNNPKYGTMQLVSPEESD